MTDDIYTDTSPRSPSQIWWENAVSRLGDNTLIYLNKLVSNYRTMQGIGDEITIPFSTRFRLLDETMMVFGLKPVFYIDQCHDTPSHEEEMDAINRPGHYLRSINQSEGTPPGEE